VQGEELQRVFPRNTVLSCKSLGSHEQTASAAFNMN